MSNSSLIIYIYNDVGNDILRQKFVKNRHKEKKMSKKTPNKFLKKPHRKKIEWLPVKYFILEEILDKGSLNVQDLLTNVNIQLANIKEKRINRNKLIELINKIQGELPELRFIDKISIDGSQIAFRLLKNLPQNQDISGYIERIISSTNDPSLQILKLLWKFQATEQGDIYKKLRNVEENPHEKFNLVNKVCQVLQKKKIHHVMLSTGVTMFELARQIIQQNNRFGIEGIISSNMLIHIEFLLRKTPSVQLSLGTPPGKMLFQQETASFGQVRELTDEEIKSDIMENVQASVLSFTSLSFNEGFKIGLGHQDDIKEKIIHLRPPKKCKLVIIVIDWEKILSKNGVIVQDTQDQKGYKLFDISDGREYLIITNRPEITSSKEDKDRAEDLKLWEEKGNAIVIDTDDKLRKYINK